LITTKVATYVASLNARGLKPRTISSWVSIARSFVKHLQELGLCDRSPLDYLRRPKFKLAQPGRYLTVTEMRALVEVAGEISPRHYTLTLLAATTGMRASELA